MQSPTPVTIEAARTHVKEILGDGGCWCERPDCGWKTWLIVKLANGISYFPRSGDRVMDRTSGSEIELNDEEQRLYDRLGDVFEEERRRMAQALAGAGSQLFGRAEYELRDQVHRLGARALEVAANERQKKGWIRGC